MKAETNTVRTSILGALAIGALLCLPALPAAGGAVDLPGFKTRNVVIVVADGERYSETFGDPRRTNIPETAALASEGVLLTAFMNNGKTSTNPGHAAITTGRYQDIMDNSGKSPPSDPSIFQAWLHHAQTNSSAAWILASKHKLVILADACAADWRGMCLPSVDCADRADTDTLQAAQKVLKRCHPRLMLVNFSAPDRQGHSGNFDSYLAAIREADRLTAALWKSLQEDAFYAGQTALFVINDHGRHDGDKFKNHGCPCNGCRHLKFLALGPDFKRGAVADAPAEQIDLAPTVAALMNFKLPAASGLVLNEIFIGAPAVPDAVPKPAVAPASR